MNTVTTEAQITSIPILPIRTFATTTTLAVNTTPGLTATGIRGPYDWTLPNIVDDDGALRSAFLAKNEVT
jgi:hypothetical protein